MKRREFVVGAAAAVAWPIVARAQEQAPTRRIGVLVPAASDDAEGQARVLAFRNSLQKAGWNDGANLRIEIRWGSGDVRLIRKGAAELVALHPDVIFASGTVS